MHSYIASNYNQAGRLLIPIFTAGALLTTATVAHATNTWLNNWRNIYPSSLSDENASCALCHTTIDTGGNLNAYGSEVRSSGITGAAGADSDGQGDANLVEINADTQPAWSSSAPAGVVGLLDPVMVVINDPPTADPGGPYTASVGENIAFDGTNSFDPDGSISSYAWDFGDGGSGNGSTPSHAYSVDGNYTVSLTVTDNDNATDSATTTATIISVSTSAPPIADAGGPYSGAVGSPLTFNGTNSSDPDGGTIVRYDWDFGDGSAASDAGSTPSHSYTATGDYTVILTVTDDEGDSGSDTATATIGSGDLPPIADAGGPYTADIGETVTFDATGSSDPDGTIVRYDWEFGDGSFLLDGGATPSHSYSTAGTFNVILTVIDDVDLSDTVSTQATIIDPLDVPVDEDDEERDRDDDARDSDDEEQDRDDDEQDSDDEEQDRDDDEQDSDDEEQNRDDDERDSDDEEQDRDDDGRDSDDEERDRDDD
ncbi:MAG: PKD domain-containing protein [Pseudomonadota bacterium]